MSAVGGTFTALAFYVLIFFALSWANEISVREQCRMAARALRTCSKPVCVKWECKSAKLSKLKPGKSLQTSNGFITNKTGEVRHVCPKCAAFYVIGK